MNIKAYLPKNLSIAWVLSTALAIWFLFVYSPPKLKNVFFGDYPFAMHLIGAYLIYLACIHNTIMTPSCLEGKGRAYHVWIGRIGLVAGFIGFAFGAYCAWSPLREHKPEKSFAIGITIGGVFQVSGSVWGYACIRRYQALKQKISNMSGENMDTTTSNKGATARDDPTEEGSGEHESSPSIVKLEEQDGTLMTELDELKLKRDSALKMHIRLMSLLFVMACGMPAFMRFAGEIYIFDWAGAWVNLITVIILFAVTYFLSRTYIH